MGGKAKSEDQTGKTRRRIKWNKRNRKERQNGTNTHIRKNKVEHIGTHIKEQEQGRRTKRKRQIK